MTTWSKSSSNWANGNVPDETHLDNWETGIYAAANGAYLAGLGKGALNQASGGPTLLLELRRKASAFTFGTAPKTSDGYFRVPGGGPWGADSISGRPFDRTPTSETTTSTVTDTLISNKLYLLPAFNASITVSRIDVQLSLAYYATGAPAAHIDKIGLQVVKIAADGTETNVGSEAFESTAANHSTGVYQLIQRFLSSTGLSGTILATERLGIRIKVYGHLASGVNTVHVVCPADLTSGEIDAGASVNAAFQLGPTPVAIWY